MRIFATVVAVCASLVASQAHQRSLPHHGRVIGGSKPQESYPWIVGIRQSPTDDNWCGGSLIAPDYVLTAAHCLHFKFVSPPVIYLSIGSHYLNGTDGEIRTVAAHWSAGYSTVQGGNDIAIIKLNESSTKPTIPLGLNIVGPNTTTTILGWGQSSIGWDSTGSYELLQANLTVIGSGECQRRVRGSNASSYLDWNITNTHLCAGGINGTGSCYGDSGGPLIARKTNNGTQVLVGDISFGVVCAAGIPDVFGRISSAKEFIDTYSRGHQWV